VLGIFNWFFWGLEKGSFLEFFVELGKVIYVW
jgi:hypothetical protein